MNIPLFICLLFCLQFFYWFIGQKAGKSSKDTEDYFLAGRQVRLFPLMMTFLATQVGGGVILGAAEEAYRYGWPVLLYPAGAALGLILLGCGVGRRLASFGVTTVSQIFEIAYGSAGLKKWASILSVLSLFMILVAQIIASHKFMTGLGFNNIPLFVLFWAIVVIYTAQGGLKGVIATDMAQAAFFSVVFLFCFGFAVIAQPEFSTLTFSSLSKLESVSSKWCGWLLMPVLFMVIEQDMGQRCFAGASPRVVSRASFLAGICTFIVCIGPVFFGVLASEMQLEIPEGGSVLMSAIAEATGPWMTAVVGCAVLAAIISTATSLINAICSNLSTDFELSKGMRLTGVKCLTGILSSGAIFFAFYFDHIVDLLIQSYELSSSCLFVPLVYALWNKKCPPLAGWMAVIFGAAGSILFRIYPLDFPKELASLFLSFTGYLCGNYMPFLAYLAKKAVRSHS